MNWEEELLDLYNANQDIAGKVVSQGNDKTVVLAPVYHMLKNADVEVELDKKGCFIAARKLMENEKSTLVPMTYAAAGRTSRVIAPYPLFDDWEYLSGDYADYFGGKDSKYTSYMEGLNKWRISDENNIVVSALYSYLSKKSLIHDLIASDVVDKTKDGKVKKSKIFIRFIVDGEKYWLNRNYQKKFIELYKTSLVDEGLDYLTGSREPVLYKGFPKFKGNNKLLSSNDESNYTYRGRFSNREEAFSIGAESYQKIHNALKWIIDKQGYSLDEFTMVTWESSQRKMPDWNDDAEEIVSKYYDEFFVDGWDDEETEVYDSNYITARQFNVALKGYMRHVNNTSRMIFVSVNAATTGRLALTEYKTLDSSRYLDNIAKWHKEGEWRHVKDNGKVTFFGMPGINDIAEMLCGIENKNGKLEIRENSRKAYIEIINRLIPCVWNGQHIPYDLVQKCIIKASMPLSYKNRMNWKRVISMSCSFVKKYRFERYKETWDMSLDKKCKDRSYLYGRLLAIADRIEYTTYDEEKDAKRITNAKRYMNAFSQHPYTTWKVIEERIQPYLAKLNPGSRVFYSKLLDEVQNLFTIETFEDNKRLGGLYLLGFHSQAFEMNHKDEK